MELTAEPFDLWVTCRLLRVGEVYAPLLSVAVNTSPAEFVEHVSLAFGMAHELHANA